VERLLPSLIAQIQRYFGVPYGIIIDCRKLVRVRLASGITVG